MHLLKDLESQGTLPDKIYVEDASVDGTGQQTKYLYQFCMMDKSVISTEPLTKRSYDTVIPDHVST